MDIGLLCWIAFGFAIPEILKHVWWIRRALTVGWILLLWILVIMTFHYSDIYPTDIPIIYIYIYTYAYYIYTKFYIPMFFGLTALTYLDHLFFGAWARGMWQHADPSWGHLPGTYFCSAGLHPAPRSRHRIGPPWGVPWGIPLFWMVKNVKKMTIWTWQGWELGVPQET